MNEKRHRPGVLGPLILISIGVLLLLNQMGMLPGDFWWSLWRYWPVILILAGIEVLFGASGSRWLYLLGVLLAIAVLGGLIGYAILRGDSTAGVRPSADTETVSQALQDADRALVNLRMGAGEIRLGVIENSPNLAEGRVDYSKRSSKVVERFDLRSGRAEWTLSSGQGSSSMLAGEDLNERWDLKLSSRVPLEVDIEMGAGKVAANLKDVKASNVDIDLAVGDVTVTLPASAGTARLTVKMAVGEITIIAPAGVGLRVRPSKLLGSFEVSGLSMSQSGSYWVTDNYATAANKVDLRAELVIGSIKVR